MAPRADIPSLANEPLADVLRLIRAPNVGPVTFFQLLRRCGSVAAALERLPELSRQKSQPHPLAQAEREIVQAQKFGARMLRYGEPDYPPLLLHIPDPPPVLTVHGNAGLWQGRPAIALVGARNASANACAFAQKLAKEIGAQGVTVISGLARGIDSFVHKGALATGTVGVIAGGIDHIYPPENAMLYKQLRENGAVVTEQPFAQIPFASAFPARNRIISGMCLGVAVVEASVKSGSLITARLALEQGREVAAVPGFPLDPRAAGGNKLIKDGAHLIESAQDILDALLRQPSASHFAEPPPPPFAHEAPPEADIDRARETLLAALNPSPIAVDALLQQTGLPAGLLLAALLELELAGEAVRLPGGAVCRNVTA